MIGLPEKSLYRPDVEMWRDRAEGACVLAELMTDPVCRQTMAQTPRPTRCSIGNSPRTGSSIQHSRRDDSPCQARPVRTSGAAARIILIDQKVPAVQSRRVWSRSPPMPQGGAASETGSEAEVSRFCEFQTRMAGAREAISHEILTELA